jgi:hypothetical protein
MGLFRVLDGCEGLGFSAALACRRALGPTARRRVARLRELGERFQQNMVDFCEEDRSQIQQLFDTWTVRVNPNVDDLVRRDTGLAALTNPEARTTRFDYRFFANPGMREFTFYHEFRHLMPGNRVLSDALDIGQLINPNSNYEQTPVEVDADAWARYARGPICKCGYDR